MRVLSNIIAFVAWVSAMVSAGLAAADLHAESRPSMTVSLLTCGEGREIYELEGHTALRIKHLEYGDFVVNWGVFDFNSPNFVYRFVKGETDYMAAAAPTMRFIDSYYRQGRTVREQVLNLDSVACDALLTMVMTNLQPENRVYRYNYVLDNCATRPLAVIEAALGDTVTLGRNRLPRREHTTFRDVMRHFHKNYPWYQFGIDLALGVGIDYDITPRATTFAPVVLADMLAEARMPSQQPLVLHDGYIIGSPDTPEVKAGATPWYLSPTAVACLIFALSLTVSVYATRYARLFDTIFFALSGLAGLLLTFLIFVSVHEATSPNWLYLWLNPLCFTGAVAPWLKHGNRLDKCYQSVNFALLIALTVIFLTGVQSANPAFWPLMAASATRSLAIIVKRPVEHTSPSGIIKRD